MWKLTVGWLTTEHLASGRTHRRAPPTPPGGCTTRTRCGSGECLEERGGDPGLVVRHPRASDGDAARGRRRPSNLQRTNPTHACPAFHRRFSGCTGVCLHPSRIPSMPWGQPVLQEDGTGSAARISSGSRRACPSDGLQPVPRLGDHGRSPHDVVAEDASPSTRSARRERSIPCGCGPRAPQPPSARSSAVSGPRSRARAPPGSRAAPSRTGLELRQTRRRILHRLDGAAQVAAEDLDLHQLGGGPRHQPALLQPPAERERLAQLRLRVLEPPGQPVASPRDPRSRPRAPIAPRAPGRSGSPRSECSSDSSSRSMWRSASATFSSAVAVANSCPDARPIASPSSASASASTSSPSSDVTDDRLTSARTSDHRSGRSGLERAAASASVEHPRARRRDRRARTAPSRPSGACVPGPRRRRACGPPRAPARTWPRPRRRRPGS